MKIVFLINEYYNLWDLDIKIFWIYLKFLVKNMSKYIELLF